MVGAPPEVSALPGYLQGVPEEMHAELLQDLVSEHLRAAWGKGIGQPLESYCEALHGLGGLENLPSSLIEDELLARYQIPGGDLPSPEQYARRFARRSDVMKLIADRYLAGGRYVRLQTLGLGATGEVFRAYDRHLSRMVAVKRPRVEQRGNAELRHRFIEEGRLTATLEHPGIAGIHECLEMDDGTPLHIMRLVTGRTLGERIREYHHRRPEYPRGMCNVAFCEFVRSVLMVADAVAYAHAHGVLHCDLKPGNIMGGDCGEVALLDWGNARRINQRDGICRETGTPEYMPPEQADGIADVRSDVFGIGAILYELLAGTSPHGWAEGIRPKDWRERVRAACFERPSRAQHRIPRDLESICLHALEKEPERRYQTVAELAADLRRYLCGEPVAARQGILTRLLRHFR